LLGHGISREGWTEQGRSEDAPAPRRTIRSKALRSRATGAVGPGEGQNARRPAPSGTGLPRLQGSAPTQTLGAGGARSAGVAAERSFIASTSACSDLNAAACARASPTNPKTVQS
jgi:hypothetical protein